MSLSTTSTPEGSGTPQGLPTGDATTPNEPNEPAEMVYAEVEPIIGESSIQAEVEAYADRQLAPLQQIVLPEDCTKGDAIELLQRSVPVNEIGLPQFFYRSDLLPFGFSSTTVITTKDIDAAQVQLDYSDGFPVFNGAHLFWSQLPNEPHVLFALFEAYLDQAQTEGVRQLQLLASQQKFDLIQVAEASKEFYWKYRARAYDLFQVTADRRRRENRILSMENQHFLRVEALANTLLAKFDDPKWIEELNYKDALDALDQLWKFQRLSLGLTGAAASSLQAPINPAMDTATLMQEFAKQGKSGLISNTGGMPEEIRALMMSDPDFARRTQALILQITTAHNVEQVSVGQTNLVEGL